MDFKYKLYYILSELEKHKRSRSEMFSQQVQKRLDASLREYTKELETSVDYLSKRKELNVLKRFNKGGNDV